MINWASVVLSRGKDGGVGLRNAGLACTQCVHFPPSQQEFPIYPNKIVCTSQSTPLQHEKDEMEHILKGEKPGPGGEIGLFPLVIGTEVINITPCVCLSVLMEGTCYTMIDKGRK